MYFTTVNGEVIFLLAGGDKRTQQADIDTATRLAENLELSTDKVKVSPFNPVDHMETDEEIIEFIVDCYDEDPGGRVYLRACQFLGDSRGVLKTYEILQRATREIASRNQQPSLKHAIA